MTVAAIQVQDPNCLRSLGLAVAIGSHFFAFEFTFIVVIVALRGGQCCWYCVYHFASMRFGWMWSVFGDDHRLLGGRLGC